MLAGYDLSIVVDTVNKAVNLVATGISAQYWDGTDTVADNEMCIRDRVRTLHRAPSAFVCN